MLHGWDVTLLLRCFSADSSMHILQAEDPTSSVSMPSMSVVTF